MKTSLPLHLSKFFIPAFWFLAIIFLALNVALKWTQVTSYAPEWGGFERNVIWGIQQIMQGKPLYSNPEAAPFAIVQYMPLYYYTVAGLGNLFSVDPLDAHQVYTLARSVSFCCCIFSSILLILMALRFRVGKEIAVATGLIAFFWMNNFAIAARPDSFKALVFQLIVFVLIQFPEKRKRIIFPLVVLLSLAGFMSKQDGLVFSGILPLVLCYGGSWKETILWGGLTALFHGFILFLIQSNTHGAFFQNVAGGLQNGISISWFINAFGGYFAAMAILFGLALVLAFEFAFEQNWKLRVLSAAMVCSFFPSLFFAFKYGSGANYFLEATLISLLLFGIWLQSLDFKRLFVFPKTHQLFGLLVFSLLFYVAAMQWVAGVFLNSEKDLKANYLNQKEVADYLKTKYNGQAKVLVNFKRQWEESLTGMLPNHVVCPQRDVAIQVFDAKGKISFEPFQKSVLSGMVQFVVTEKGQNPSFLNCDFSHFEKTETIGNFTVWSRR